MARFCRFVLRTTDVAAAGTFYDEVLGHRGDGIIAIPPEALARGARPMWLGHVDVGAAGGVEAVLARFLTAGATRLGPPGAHDPVLVRDAGGAILALTGQGGPASSAAGAEGHARPGRVVWHVLNTPSGEQAARAYAGLFGWSFGAVREMGAIGRVRELSFLAGEPSVGSVADLAGRPGVHPQWLHVFGVSDLDRALAVVRARGGLALEPVTLPDGARFAACDDPQGAAFGLGQAGEWRTVGS